MGSRCCEQGTALLNKGCSSLETSKSLELAATATISGQPTTPASSQELGLSCLSASSARKPDFRLQGKGPLIVSSQKELGLEQSVLINIPPLWLALSHICPYFWA
eukprot:506449-Amphidinium_carterae.1